MKDYIKAVTTGILTGITVTLLFGIALDSYLERPLTLGGEFLLPVVIAEAVYIGWKSAYAYFKKVNNIQAYRKGFNDGMKIHTYFFSFPTDENNTNTEVNYERISD